MKLFTARPLALSILASALLVSGARADVASDLAARIKALYAVTGVTAVLGAATTQGSDIVYDGLTVDFNSGDTSMTYRLPAKLDFTDVKAASDGSFTADALKVPDIDATSEGSEFTAKNIVFKNIYISGAANPTMVDSGRLFGSATAGPLALSVDGTPAMTIDSIALNNSFAPSQTDPALAKVSSSFSTSGLKIDFSGVKDADTLAQIKAFDLLTTAGKIAEDLSWSLPDGHVAFNGFSAQVDKVGKLSFGFDLTGYTPALAEQLGKLSQTFAQMESAQSQADQQKQMALLLNSLQTLFLNSASLRYDDDSITGKALDMAAKQAGATRAAFIDALVAQIPEQMGPQSGVPVDLVKETQAAIRAFLTDPKSIEIKLAPPAPLGVLSITAAVMAPMDLAAQVGLHVLVNDKEITAAEAANETGVAPPDSSGSSDDNSGSGDSSGSDSSN